MQIFTTVRNIGRYILLMMFYPGGNLTFPKGPLCLANNCEFIYKFTLKYNTRKMVNILGEWGQ